MLGPSVVLLATPCRKRFDDVSSFPLPDNAEVGRHPGVFVELLKSKRAHLGLCIFSCPHVVGDGLVGYTIAVQKVIHDFRRCRLRMPKQITQVLIKYSLDIIEDLAAP